MQAFEQYDSVEDPMAAKALKYMLLSKVMLNLHDEVTGLAAGKLALRCCNVSLDRGSLRSQARRTRHGVDEGGGPGRQGPQPRRLPGRRAGAGRLVRLELGLPGALASHLASGPCRRVILALAGYDGAARQELLC